jgi:hypothetical protein
VKKKSNGQPIGEPFFPVVHSLFESDKYRALPALAVLILHLLMYRHGASKNSGEISLGCREAADWYQVSPATAWRAFQRLQADGFVTEIHKGHLVPIAGRNISSTWRLNIRPFASKGNSSQIGDCDCGQTATIACFSSRVVRATRFHQ